MTDNVKAIMEKLDKAEEAHRNKRKVLRESLDECARLKTEYAEKLRTETDPKEYSDLIMKNEENERRYTALIRQNNEKKAPALSRNELEDIRRDLRREATAIQAQHAPAIVDALKKLIPLANAYTEDMDELERIGNGASRLAGVIGFSRPYDNNAIINEAPEDFADVLNAFFCGYALHADTFRKYKGE